MFLAHQFCPPPRAGEGTVTSANRCSSGRRKVLGGRGGLSQKLDPEQLFPSPGPVCPLPVIRMEFPEISTPDPGENTSPRSTFAAHGPPKVLLPFSRLRSTEAQKAPREGSALIIKEPSVFNSAVHCSLRRPRLTSREERQVRYLMTMNTI